MSEPSSNSKKKTLASVIRAYAQGRNSSKKETSIKLTAYNFNKRSKTIKRRQPSNSNFYAIQPAHQNNTTAIFGDSDTLLRIKAPFSSALGFPNPNSFSKRIKKLSLLIKIDSGATDSLHRKIIDDNNQHERRFKLQQFAITELEINQNQASAFVNIVQKSVDIISSEIPEPEYPSGYLIGDLSLVIIGDNPYYSRGTGKYFSRNVNGAKGFKSEFVDRFNQIQHAMAGIYFGFYLTWPVRQYILYLETEEQDDRLYEATFALGNSLNDQNYKNIPDRIRKAICDQDTIIKPNTK